MLSDTPLFLHIVFNNVCVKVVHYWPARTRRTGLARKQIDKSSQSTRSRVDSEFFVDEFVWGGVSGGPGLFE